MRYCPNLLHQSSKAGIQTDARFVHYTVGAGFKSAPTVHLYYITVLGRPDTLYALGCDGPANGRAAPQTKSVGKGIGCILLSLGLFCRGQVFCHTFSLLFPDRVFYAPAWRCQASASGHSSGAFFISGAVSPPGSFWPKDGTKKYLRMMKISAMAPTLTRFCTASSWPTIIWRAMA